MKRNIFLILLSLSLFVGRPCLANNSNNPANEKSKVELYVQQLAKIKSAEINYAYISFNMLKRLFSAITENQKKLVGAVSGKSDSKVKIEASLIDATIELTPLSAIKSVRRFHTTGPNGYRKLRASISPFLSEEENVMGMELMAINREDGLLSAIYSDSKSVLIINDDGMEELTIVLVVGLSYTMFEELMNEGVDLESIF